MIGAIPSQSSVQRMDRPPPRTTGASASGGVDTSSTDASDKLSQLFSSIDSDGSGGLSSSELQSFVDTMSKDTRGALLSVQEGATSSDGTSATSSTSSSSAEAFDAIDADGDGAISESELSGFLQANMPPPPPPPDGGAEGASSSTSSASSSSGEASDLLTSMDTDGDGSVSQSELSSFLEANAPPPPPPPEASGSSSTASAGSSSSSEETSGTASSGSSSAFSAIDTNQDGQISKAELDAYLAQSSASGSSGSTTSTSTGSTSSSGASADALASLLNQMLQQSYQRMQVSTAEMQASLTKSLDSVA